MQSLFFLFLSQHSNHSVYHAVIFLWFSGIFLQFSLVSPEKQSDKSRTGMAADGCSDIIDQHFSVKLRESSFYHIR